MWISRLIRLAVLFGLVLLGNSIDAFAQHASAPPRPEIKEPYHIGVWFYPSWNDAALSTWGPQHWRPVYGRADTWGGVRDFAEHKGAFLVQDPLTGAPIDYSGRQPLLGFYDLLQQQVIDSEIQMAASEGIEFFAFYWYVDALTGKEQPMSAPTKLFFSSHVRQKLKFVLAPIIGADQPKDVISLKTWRESVVPGLISYMASDVYYRPGGRPLIIDFAWKFATPDEYKAALAALRDQSFARLGVKPLIISIVSARSTYNDVHYGLKSMGVDGFTCFQPPIEGSPESYEAYVARAIPWMKSTMAPPQMKPDADLLYAPCGAIGRDAHPWQTDNSTSETKWTIGTSPDLWRRYLEQIKLFVDSGYVNTMRTVFLYAWNEWGESAEQIEPSKTKGYTYADVVRKVFDLRPRIPQPLEPR